MFVAVSTAWNEHGLFWPDEIYQITEPAHRLVFGYGFRSWEFQDGLRSWFLPSVIGAVWATADRLGVGTGLGLMRVARLLVAFGGVGAVAAAMTWAHRTRGSLASLLAGLLLLVTPFTLLMNVHTFAETVAASLLVAAALAVPGGKAPEVKTTLVLLCGIAAGFAIPIRPQSALLVGGFIVIMLLERRRDCARVFAISVGAVILLSGVVDWVTWGVPFASFWRNVQFQLIEDGASKYFGDDPFSFFFVHLGQTYGIFGLLICIGLLAALWIAPKHVINVLVFVFVHSLISHKELRFIYPVIPYATAVSAVGLSFLASRIYLAVAPPQPVVPIRKGKRKRGEAAAIDPAPSPHRSSKIPLGATALVLAAFGAVAIVHASSLTFRETGNTVFWEADASVWNNAAGWNHLLSSAGQRPDTCGVAIGVSGPGEGAVFTGGFGYLHLDVPVYTVDAASIEVAPPELRAVNVILVGEDVVPPPGYSLFATNRKVAMLVRDGSCDPAPSEYTTDLPRPDGS
ncbi:MAG: hypothetical protein ACOYL9_11535 [Ilumatobacteraceae bacterium]